MTSTENDTVSAADPIPVGAQVERDVVDRTGWLPGPWDGEPDCVRWFDRATGLACIINRPDGLGSLNGYVAVGRTHPLFDVDYTDVEGYDGTPLASIDVHGGLTYSGVDPDGRGPYEGTWWFGFDCVHWRDLAPYRTKPEYRRRVAADGSEYRDLAYVVAEVQRLAGQIAAVAR